MGRLSYVHGEPPYLEEHLVQDPLNGGGLYAASVDDKVLHCACAIAASQGDVS